MNTPTAIEINFDGLVGPTHNFAALSLGNIASAKYGGQTSSPRDAALEGLEKMRTLLRLGLTQGFLPPLRRPAAWVLSRLGYRGTEKEMLAEVAQRDPELLARISSASAMWTANAATVIAAPDSADGRVHLITANLSTMFHRAIEQEETAAKLARVFDDARHFVVRPALPLGAHLGDEGAANHMRIAPSHGERGINVFVYGEESGRFPARQAERASRAVARIGGLAENDALFVRQASAAVQAGAFHNDVVAVANENVLLCHAQAFEGGAADETRIAARLPGLHVLRVENLSLDEAVQTYLFNSQLVTLPGENAGMALVLPIEAREHEAVWREVEAILGADNPVKQAIAVDVRGSMKNGGGPACLRLRVPVSQEALAGIDPAYLLNEARLDAMAKIVETHWPTAIAPSDLADPALWDAAYGALAALEDWIARSG